MKITLRLHPSSQAEANRAAPPQSTETTATGVDAVRAYCADIHGALDPTIFGLADPNNATVRYNVDVLSIDLPISLETTKNGDHSQTVDSAPVLLAAHCGSRPIDGVNAPSATLLIAPQ